MIDTTTFPFIVIKPGKYGDIEITDEYGIYYLSHSGKKWSQYNTLTDLELYEQWSGYDLAYGDVLISGFGFGHFALWLASKPEVKSITCLEVSQDVVDAFLENNVLPDNVSIVITDADTYTTDKKYDCVIFDHFDGELSAEFYKQVCTNAKKIPHDLFWFWSLELYYLRYYYGITISHIYLHNLSYERFDFGKKWNKLKENLDMKTIPNLSKETLDIYINTFSKKDM